MLIPETTLTHTAFVNNGTFGLSITNAADTNIHESFYSTNGAGDITHSDIRVGAGGVNTTWFGEGRFAGFGATSCNIDSGQNGFFGGGSGMAGFCVCDVNCQTIMVVE